LTSEEFGLVEDAFWEIDQMRAVALDRASGGRCCGQEPGVAAHHDRNVNARQRTVVEIGPHECLGYEPCGRGKAWRVIALHQVVVNGLGNMDRAQIVMLLRRFLAHDTHGFGRIVAADIEEPRNAMSLQRTEDVPTVGQVWFVPRRAEDRGRRGGDRLEIGSGLGRKVDEILVRDAAHPKARAIDTLDLRKEPRFQYGTNQRLIDYRRWAAAFGDHQLAGAHCLWLPVKTRVKCRQEL
jgi:hypothetical protein